MALADKLQELRGLKEEVKNTLLELGMNEEEIADMSGFAEMLSFLCGVPNMYRDELVTILTEKGYLADGEETDIYIGDLLEYFRENLPDAE